MMSFSYSTSWMPWSLVLLIVMASCSSSTRIESIPPGARLFVDGESVGVTPYIHTDQKIVSSTLSIRMEKEGYRPFLIDISKDEEINLGPAIAGFFLFVPWLWGMKYQAVHTY